MSVTVSYGTNLQLDISTGAMTYTRGTLTPGGGTDTNPGAITTLSPAPIAQGLTAFQSMQYLMYPSIFQSNTLTINRSGTGTPPNTIIMKIREGQSIMNNSSGQMVLVNSLFSSNATSIQLTLDVDYTYYIISGSQQYTYMFSNNPLPAPGLGPYLTISSPNTLAPCYILDVDASGKTLLRYYSDASTFYSMTLSGIHWSIDGWSSTTTPLVNFLYYRVNVAQGYSLLKAVKFNEATLPLGSGFALLSVNGGDTVSLPLSSGSYNDTILPFSNTTRTSTPMTMPPIPQTGGTPPPVGNPPPVGKCPPVQRGSPMKTRWQQAQAVQQSMKRQQQHQHHPPSQLVPRQQVQQHPSYGSYPEIPGRLGSSNEMTTNGTSRACTCGRCPQDLTSLLLYDPQAGGIDWLPCHDA